MEVFDLIREGMKSAKSAALACTVLFRRMRTILIQPHGRALIATTLNFEYEVRSAKEAFGVIPEMEISSEMLDLAIHIIETKKGTFDPHRFDDRYEAALGEMIKSKLEGKTIKPPKAASEGKVVDLMEALRQSAGMKKAGSARAKSAKPTASGRKKAS